MRFVLSLILSSLLIAQGFASIAPQCRTVVKAAHHCSCCSAPSSQHTCCCCSNDNGVGKSGKVPVKIPSSRKSNCACGIPMQTGRHETAVIVSDNTNFNTLRYIASTPASFEWPGHEFIGTTIAATPPPLIPAHAPLSFPLRI
jgi:hypothetical protein